MTVLLPTPLVPGCRFFGYLLLGSLVLAGPAPTGAEDAKPIEIAEVKRDGAVDFEKEILPIFRRNCLACHNSTEAESSLVLETPQTILKGGSTGPAAVAGQGTGSLLLQLASRQKESFMPPDGNKVGAKRLTPQELGLLKLWIDQGAKGEVRSLAAAPTWQPLPKGVNPIYTVAISPDGQYLAAGRANQVFVYHAPTKRELGRLTDPSVLQSKIYDKPGVAFFDLVQSLAFSPDGETLAAGGYREVKIFKRPKNAKVADLAGLEAAPLALAVSADGKWAAFGEESGRVKVYDLSTNQLARKLEGHAGAITALQFSLDGARLFSGSKDKTLRSWNLADGAPLMKIDTPAEVTALALLAKDTQIAGGGADNAIRVWNVPALGQPATDPVRTHAGHTGPVTSLAALNDNHLVSGSKDGTVRHWNEAGQQVRAMNHGGPVDSVGVRNDNQRIASAGANVAKLWNTPDGAQVAELKGDFRAQLGVQDLTRGVNLSKRRVDLAKADLDATNKRKEEEEKNQKAAEEAKKKADDEFKAKVEAVKKPVADKEAADKELVVAQEAQKKGEEAIKASDEAIVKAGEAMKKAQADYEATLKAAQEMAKALEIAQANAKKAEETKAAAEKVVKDAEAKKKEAEAAKAKAEQDTTTAKTGVAAADKKVKELAPVAQKAVDERNAAEKNFQASERSLQRAMESVKKAADEIPVADAAHKKEQEKQAASQGKLDAATKALPETEKPLRSVAFSADGSMLAVGGEDQLVHTYDATTGVAIETLAGHGAMVTSVAFAGDRLVSGAANNSAVVWNTNPDWQLARTIGKIDDPAALVDRVTALAFSRDGKWLATGSGEPSRSGQLKIWNAATGELAREIADAHSDTIFAIEFSPEDEFVATCGADRFMKVFSVAEGKFIRAFEGHTHHVLGVTWSADGRTLATCGADKVIKVWTFLTGDQQRTISNYQKELTSIRFVSDTVNVVASCGDNNVHIARTDNGGAVRALSGGADFMYAVTVSADGKTFAAGGQDSVLRIWNDNGQVLATFAPPAAK